MELFVGKRDNQSLDRLFWQDVCRDDEWKMDICFVLGWTANVASEPAYASQVWADCHK